jgi:hypothetical protein
MRAPPGDCDLPQAVAEDGHVRAGVDAAGSSWIVSALRGDEGVVSVHVGQGIGQSLGSHAAGVTCEPDLARQGGFNTKVDSVWVMWVRHGQGRCVTRIKLCRGE